MLSTLRRRFSGDESGLRLLTPPYHVPSLEATPYDSILVKTHLDREEGLVGIAGVLVEEAGKELKVTRSQVVCVEFTAVEEHLRAGRYSVDPGFDGLKALLVGHWLRAAPSRYR